ncbi:MAG: response regulator transcription factor [Verrucomicrobiales bacterium]|nr:response regulator transcription factor [Verrucomicrobiales bacterium]
MQSTGPWKTVVLEGQTLVRELLAKAIADDARFELVGEAGDGTTGREVIRRRRPNLVVVDLQMMGIDGLELIRGLRRELPRVRTLALAATPSPLMLNRAREVGVHGMVERDQSLEVFLEALGEIGEGRRYFAAEHRRTYERLQSDPQSFPKFLTGREQDILRYVVEGRTSKDIAERLDLSPRSVETFRYRLMRKLGVRNLAALIEFAFRSGLMRGESGSSPT